MSRMCYRRGWNSKNRTSIQCVWLLHMHCGSLFIAETSFSVDFYDFYNVVWWLRWPFNVMTFCLFQDSFYSIALKSLISVSTVILLGLILAYHALEVQVSYRKLTLQTRQDALLPSLGTFEILRSCVFVDMRSVRMTHYNDVIMSTMASQITSLTIVYSNFYSGADQRKHQSSASPAFVRGIHRSPHKGPVTRKMFPFVDLIMNSKVPLQYIPKIMHIVSLCCVLLWFVSDYFYPYASGLLHWYQGNHAILQCPWNNLEEYGWIGHSNVSIIDVTIKTKQSKTHSCVYYMG